MNKFKILPKKYVSRKVDVKALKNSAIILHLYYDLYFDEAKKNMDNIPSDIDTYIVTANKKLEVLAKKYSSNKSNIKILFKPNRGRDFAALLITCKEIVKKYKYVCFVHDKNARSDSDVSYTNRWRKLFYESTLCSEEYIFNIINEFENNKRLGLLSAPIPAEQLALEFRGITWFGNVDLTKEWLKRIGINNMIDLSQDSITIGSVFWFRPEAIKQLFEYSFKYSDFEAEPMPHDFTLAHTLERLVGLLSENNGYKNYYVINDAYAETYLSITDSFLMKSMKVLRVNNSIVYDDNNGVNLNKSYRKALHNNKLQMYCKKYKDIIVVSDNSKWYDDFLFYLKRNDILVSKIVNTRNFNLDDYKNDVGIIVCSSNETLLNKLKNRDFFLYNCCS